MAVELADAKGSLKVTADELGITPQILTRWRRERVASQNTGSGSRAQVSQEQQEIVRLKKELKQAELDRIAEATRYLKKGGRHLLQERPRGGPWEIFGFIKAHQSVFPVETGPPVRMCKVLQVSRSGYYYWLAQRPAKRAKENKAILVLINTAFTSSKGRYGSPKITHDLVAQGVIVSRPRIARLMKKANLKSVIQKKCVVTTTDSRHDYPVAENHLNRQFNPIKPGQSWVSDLTYIRTNEG
ncbi:hypothetical protein GCM10028818_22950 [Spirosoma horti]